MIAGAVLGGLLVWLAYLAAKKQEQRDQELEAEEYGLTYGPRTLNVNGTMRVPRVSYSRRMDDWFDEQDALDA